MDVPNRDSATLQWDAEGNDAGKEHGREWIMEQVLAPHALLVMHKPWAPAQRSNALIMGKLFGRDSDAIRALVGV